MADAPNPLEWQGRTMVDGHGDKVGKVDAIYVDDNTGDPAWALVHTGMFGSRSNFVPLREASVEGDDVHVPYEKSQIKDAPSLDAEEELSPDEERQLYDYYGVDYAAGAGHGHEGHDHEGHGHDHGHDGHDHDHEGHDHDHEHDAHDRGVGDPTPDQPVGGVEGDPTSGRPEVGQTVNPGQPVGGQVAAGAQQVGEKRLRRYTIVTEEVVREVIPVEDDAPGTEQPGPDQPPR